MTFISKNLIKTLVLLLPFFSCKKEYRCECGYIDENGNQIIDHFNINTIGGDKSALRKCKKEGQNRLDGKTYSNFVCDYY